MQKFKKFLSVCLAMVLVLSMAALAVVAEEPVGSEENPEAAYVNGYDFEMAHVFGDEGEYWFTFNADIAGLLNIKLIDVWYADAEDVTVIAYNVSSNSYVEINNQTSSAPFTAWEGETILIGILAPSGADAFVSATMMPYDDYLGCYTAEISDYTFLAYVEPMTTITFTTPWGTGINWAGMGLKVEGVFEAGSIVDPDPIPKTVVTVGGTEFTDLKNDSNIQLTMPMMGSEFSISYGMAMGPATYKISFVNESLTECDHTSLSSVGATPAGCHDDGILAHEVCNNCGSLFIDGIKVASVVDEAPNELEYIWRTVTCTEPGNIAHNHCNGCGKNYDDEGNELSSIASDALGHDMESYEAQDPTCCGEGNYEWHFCNNCYGYFKDVEGNEAYNDYSEIWIPAVEDAHIWVLAEEVDGEPLVDNVPALHTSKELIYKCECPSCWMINFADLTTTMMTDPSCGTLEFFEATEATLENEGNIDYYYCSGCGKYFADAEGTTELAEEDVFIPKKVAAGDDSMNIVYVMLMLVAALGCGVAITRKKSRI